MIKSFVRGQDLQIAQPLVVTGTLNFIEMQVEFKTSDWDGLSKWVHFTKGPDKIIKMLDSENRLTKDRHLDLTTGVWTVWIHGTSPDASGKEITRATTSEATITVQNTGMEGDHPLPGIDCDAAEQIDAKSQAALDKATQALDEVVKVKPYADSAKKSADNAKLSETNARTSEDSAKAAALKADLRASSALASQNAANDYATTAGQYAGSAKIYYDGTVANAESAAESAQKAAQSSSNAQSSELKTKTYSDNAEAAAKRAVESASGAYDVQETVRGFVNEARTAANTATSAAGTAVDASKAAADSEHNATLSSNNAGLSAESARTSEYKAGKSAENAANSAMNASTSERFAKASEDKVRADADLAQKSAEAAKASEDNAKTSETNAKGSETSASSSEQKATQAMQDFLAMLGKDVPTLDAGGKIPLEQIPATATQEIYVVKSESELTGLKAQRGDLAELIGPVADQKTRSIENRILKTWQCLGDPTSLKNWVEWGTSYAVQAGNATNAQNAVDSTMINGHRMVEMTKEQFETAVKDPTTYYLVHDPSAEV